MKKFPEFRAHCDSLIGKLTFRTHACYLLLLDTDDDESDMKSVFVVVTLCCCPKRLIIGLILFFFANCRVMNNVSVVTFPRKKERQVLRVFVQKPLAVRRRFCVVLFFAPSSSWRIWIALIGCCCSQSLALINCTDRIKSKFRKLLLHIILLPRPIWPLHAICVEEWGIDWQSTKAIN